jgi:Rieske Fe-S protein
MSDQPRTPEPDPTRRTVMRSLAVGGLALPLLAACGSGGDNATATQTAGSAPRSRHGRSGAGKVLARTSDVPVGGGTILAGPQVVLTQPAKGHFKAFSSICTHQGCPVSQISNGTIICPCHGSQFSIKDGGVVGGPAPAPLPAVHIAVHGSDITRA